MMTNVKENTVVHSLQCIDKPSSFIDWWWWYAMVVDRLTAVCCQFFWQIITTYRQTIKDMFLSK